MRVKFTDKFDSFYFIGIGGVSMSGLANYLLSVGKTVGGSDICESAYTKALRDAGAKISIGGAAEEILGYELIIYTDAIKDTDIQLCAAICAKKCVISRGQLLYEISREFRRVIAVSGCHGKTTCTAMLAHIFSCAEKKFTAHIGGNDLTFSNFYRTGNDFLITEACEYKKNFLLLKPDVGVILNSDADHLECYGSEQALEAAYLEFAADSAVAVTLYCDLPVANATTFGYDKNADFCAKKIKNRNGRYSFVAYGDGTELGTVSLNILGKHNVLNAIAAVAAASSAGIPFEKIREGLESFSGVERRFERIGEFRGVECFADYAHHPNELRASLRTFKNLTQGKLYVVFQPHTYSRTKNLFKQFLKVLSPLNNLLIYRTFAAREYFDDAGSALTLSQSLKKSRYGDDARDIESFISKAAAGDLIVFLGAGDIYDIAKLIIKNQ